MSTAARGRATRGKSCVVHTTATSVFVGREAELGALHDAFATRPPVSRRWSSSKARPGSARPRWSSASSSELPAPRVLQRAVTSPRRTSRSRWPTSCCAPKAAPATRWARPARRGRPRAAGADQLAPEDGTCVVIVDDAQLIDAESLRALLFAARRLVASRAVLLLVVRGTAEEALPRAGASSQRGRPAGCCGSGRSSRRTSRRWARRSGVVMTPEAAGRLCEHTRGNPLHARAVLRELPEDDGGSTSIARFPVPKSYAQLVRQQLDRCPPMSSSWSRRRRSSACARRCTR